MSGMKKEFITVRKIILGNESGIESVLVKNNKKVKIEKQKNDNAEILIAEVKMSIY
jgi:hypothetical protein